MSSTFRELMAVVHGLAVFASDIPDQVLHRFTDNSNVVRIVKRGSMKVHLHKIALAIFDITKHYKITLLISWVPRKLNERAEHTPLHTTSVHNIPHHTPPLS